MQCRVASSVILVLATLFFGASIGNAEVSDDSKPSVTVFPITITPHNTPDDLAKRVAQVVATLLERAGVEELETSGDVFRPQSGDDIKKIAEAFAAHVKKCSIKTQFAVFAQYEGAPGTGVNAIHTVVVDKAGKVIFAETAEKADLEKAKLPAKDLMTCSVFVAQRLQGMWKLADPLRADAPQGKMAKFWKKDAGIPDEQELEAISKRSEEFKKTLETLTCTLYPVSVAHQSNKECTSELVELLDKAGIGKPEISSIDPSLEITMHSNEQKVLWDTARAFQGFLKKNPPKTDYAAFVDYGVSDSQAHYVHTIICDRDGQWVMLDMQNSHHPDFKRIDPKSASDCNRLLVERLKKWLTTKTPE